MSTLFRFLAGGALLITSAAMSASALADEVYPNKIIRLIVGFPPGGPADIAARIVAQGMQETLKQNVIVENRTGAGGNIASKFVAKSPADGYTLLVATASFTVNPLLSSNAGYDSLKDFLPVGMVATQANALAVSSTVPANTLAELQALVAKKKMSFATSGMGTSSHITATHLFNIAWKTDATPIPYRGAGPAGQAVASGEPEIGFMTITGLLPFQQQGKVKILAVVSDKRLPSLPNVPTMAELGFAQYAPSWTAMFAPAGTPAAIVQKLNQAINQLMSKPDIQQKFAQQAMVAADNVTPKQLADYLKTEVQNWDRIVKSTGAKAAE